MNRGSLQFDEHIDPQRLVERLAHALRSAQAENVVVTPGRVSFTGGVFRLVPNWNVLGPFTRGELLIDEKAKRLQYVVSFRQLIVILSVFSVVGVGFMLASRFPMQMIPVGLAMIWLWLGGMSVLIGRARFEGFLQRVIDAAAVPSGG